MSGGRDAAASAAEIAPCPALFAVLRRLFAAMVAALIGGVCVGSEDIACSELRRVCDRATGVALVDVAAAAAAGVCGESGRDDAGLSRRDESGRRGAGSADGDCCCCCSPVASE